MHHSLLFLLLFFAVVAEAADQQVRVLVPTFDGDPSLGNPVMTAISLGLWRNLRRAAPIQGRAIGGMVVWSDEKLPDETHEVAEKLTQEIFPRCRMAVWGKAAYFGDGVVVQTFLSIPFERDETEIHPEKWRVTLHVNGRELHADVGLPQRRYEFPPLVMKPELVKEFETVGGINVFASRTSKKPIDKIDSAEFTCLESYDDVSKVRLADGTAGWVKLPSLSDSRTYVIDFVSGIIRVFRGDYNNADRSFAALVKDPKFPSFLKVDAFLYLALTKDKRKLDGSSDASKALHLDPYSMRSVQYYLAARCSAIGRKLGTAHNRERISMEIRELAAFADENAYLLPPDDDMLALVRNLASEFEPEPSKCLHAR
jgi:hypothetical protein